MLNITTITYVSGFTELTLYGIFLMLAAASLTLLFRRGHMRMHMASKSNSGTDIWKRYISFAQALGASPLIVANVLLVLTVTAHALISCQLLVDAIVKYRGAAQTVAFLSDLSERAQIARNFLLLTNSLIGDSIITWRIWLVWDKTFWVVIVPALTILGLTVSGGGLIHELIVVPGAVGALFAGLNPWLTGICVTTVCTNIYGTIMIAYRIWASNRALKNAGLFEGGRNGMVEGLVIFAESAALWTLWVLVFLVLFLSGSTASLFWSLNAPVVVGITFTLITVRVGLGWAHGSTPSTTTTSIRWATMPDRGSRSVAQRYTIQEGPHPAPHTVSLNPTHPCEREDAGPRLAEHIEPGKIDLVRRDSGSGQEFEKDV